MTSVRFCIYLVVLCLVSLSFFFLDIIYRQSIYMTMILTELFIHRMIAGNYCHSYMVFELSFDRSFLNLFVRWSVKIHKCNACCKHILYY